MRIINTCDYEKTSSFIVDLPFLMGVLDLCSGRTCGGGCGLQEFNLNISPNDILFDKLEITDVNFFNFDNSLSDGVLTIRKNIAIWYYALRNLAIGILLAILIYVGIRMAISTVASEEAKYKVMLKDWVVSFVLVFLMQYIIAFTLNANNALVNIMEKAMTNASDNSIFADIMDTFALQGADPLSFTMGFGSGKCRI